MSRGLCARVVLVLGFMASQALGADSGIHFDVRSAATGNWSDPQTWEAGKPPAEGQNVQIRPGHVVTYDLHSDTAIRAIHVGGTLRFSRDKSTLLVAGLIKVTPGQTCSEDGFVCEAHPTPPATDAQPPITPVLEIGTPDNPVPAGITATIRLKHFEGMDKETLPAIINCGGRWDIHGAPMSRTWLKLGADAKKGDTKLTLAEAVTGWRPGDRVIVTASEQAYGSGSFRPKPAKPSEAHTEERTIAAIDAAVVTLDRPLAHAHRGSGPYRAEIANLSRNVIVESADPAGVRGHTMYHTRSTGGISYAEFRHLGKEGILGKYAIHFHLVRDAMRGSGVIGASVWDSHNRWITIHGADYLLVRDCVGYQSVGHGYFLEDATEQYNVLDRNLAVQAYSGKRLKNQALSFDANDGAGFWWANGRNTLVRNVSCENDEYGFKFELRGKSSSFDPEMRLKMPDGSMKTVDVRTLPFIRFDENEAHCDGLYAINLGDESDKNPSVRGDKHHPFIARNLKVWESHYVLRPNLQYFLMDGLDAWKSVYGVYHPDYDANVYRNIRMDRLESEPINRGLDDESEQRGTFTYENLTIENSRLGRDPLIQMACTSPRQDQAGHFKNLTIRNSTSRTANVVDLGGGPRNKKLKNPVTYYFHDTPEPGRTTKVVSAGYSDGNAPDYQAIKGFTGPAVRAAVVNDPVPFPELLSPVDNLPPATMIRSVRRVDGRWQVTGVSHDNGDITAITVNGATAAVTARAAGVVDWSATLDPPALTANDGAIAAHATDAAGNVETMQHRVTVR